MRLSFIETCPNCNYDLHGLPKTHKCPECGFGYSETDVIIVEKKRGLLCWGSIALFVAAAMVFLSSIGADPLGDAGYTRGISKSLEIIVLSIYKIIGTSPSWVVEENMARIFHGTASVVFLIAAIIMWVKSKGRSFLLLRENEMRWQIGSLHPYVIHWLLIKDIDSQYSKNSYSNNDQDGSFTLILHLADQSEKIIPGTFYPSEQLRSELLNEIKSRLFQNHSRG